MAITKVRFLQTEVGRHEYRRRAGRRGGSRCARGARV